MRLLLSCKDDFAATARRGKEAKFRDGTLASPKDRE